MSNPSGPVNPLNNSPKSAEPVKPGTDRFKDLMKIDASAEKQKKKKKRSTEAEEETKGKLQAGPAEPHKNIESTKKAEKYPKIQKIGESEKRQTKHGKRSEETANELASAEAAALAQTPPLPSKDISKISQEKQQSPGALSPTTASSAAAHQELEEIVEEEQETIRQEQDHENVKHPPNKKEEAKKETVEKSLVAPSTTDLGPLFLSPPTTTPPAYTLMNAETLALFEKMVSVISILKDSGITETTLHLTTPDFANSQFYGAQIVIREYSTAPLTYNIELIGNPFAAEQFQKNLFFLRSAFNDPKYRFRVNRLEASLSQQMYPRVERKKGPSSS